MSEIACFLLLETELVRVSLRRYSRDRIQQEQSLCKAKPYRYGYCDAMVFRDVVCRPVGEPMGEEPVTAADLDDPRWPRACEACGTPFSPSDNRMLFLDRMYRYADGSGDLVTLREAPVGAMWWSWWNTPNFDSEPHKRRGGGQHLNLKTPGGDWDIDCPASNGDGWERSGDPPRVTANPSILCNKYHGWLKDGRLIETP